MSYLKVFLTTTILFSIAITNSSPNNESQSHLRVMTFNIRYDNPGDGENAWSNRKDMVVNMIRNYNAEVVGIQEALKSQLDYLAKKLPEYAWFGAGRNDGKEQGEFTAIFHLKSRLKSLEDSTFWCSETPEIPSRGWDAALNRTVTWGKFLDKTSRKIFYLFNTHFDHQGTEARLQSARLLLKNFHRISQKKPVVVTGDFNVTPESKVYQLLTKEPSGENQIGLKDARYVSENGHKGPDGTFTGFDLSKTPYGPIDYIFVTENTRVLHYETLADTFDSRYPSDHFPVLVDVVFP